eukprot:Skav200526  [mRNA]  locus=scaffold2291:63661:70974:+ [translate_table: standard]
MDSSSGGALGNSKVELAELPATASPLQFGDWLHLAGPAMRDIGGMAAQWWQLTTGAAMAFYEKWKLATPLQRVQLTPELPSELQRPCYSRTEQRGVSMLLRAISAELQQVLVTDRQLTSTAILYKLLTTYQPGGPGEKSVILQQLVQLQKASTAAEWATSLRSWRRHYGRAREVQATLPDATLLLKALEPATGFVAKEDAQAAFRLAQARVQLAVDERPEVGSVWDFSQCILAELETLMLNASAALPKDTVPLKLKAMDTTTPPPFTPGGGDAANGGSNGNGKGKGNTTSAMTPCRWFKSPGGCKHGRECRFSHSWENIADKASRCWSCGSTEHRKAACPVGSKTSTPGKSGKPSEANAPGGGVPGVPGTPAMPTKSKSSSSPGAPSGSKPSVNEMVASPESGPAGGDGQATGEDGKGSEGAKKPDATDLLQEATQLLKSLRGPAPQMKVIKLTKLADSQDGHILLDSGATHALRHARNEEEWNKAQPTMVSLADGTSDKFRLKHGTRILLMQPKDSDEKGGAWIVPMCGLTDLGYKIEWKASQCQVTDAHGLQVPVSLVNGCPMLTREDGHRVLQQMEEVQSQRVQRLLVVKRMMDAPELTVDQWDAGTALTLKLRDLFPQVPDSIMMGLIPGQWHPDAALEGQSLPWNRRKRRRVQRAKNIVVHMFAGPDHRFWERRLTTADTEVLCVDLEGPVRGDVCDDATYSYLLNIAASGRLRMLLGGPPCRTVSALRFQDDGGPPVVRTEQHPYGCPHNSPEHQALVDNDAMLWFRFLALYVLAETVRDDSMPVTGFINEQPQDPAEYRDSAEVQAKQFMSMWRTREWQRFEQLYRLQRVRFDQGAMGHPKRKPTTIATNVSALGQLDEIRGAPSDDLVKDRSTMTLAQRCQDSKSWSAWAVGLKNALVVAIRAWVAGELGSFELGAELRHGSSNPSSPRRSRKVMNRLTAEALEMWKQHFANDHLPARRDCRFCLQGQGRSKPHRRVRHPDAFSLAVDLSGRLTPGEDQTAGGHGTKVRKYLMVATYTMPVDVHGRPLISPPGFDDEAAAGSDPVDQPLPGLDVQWDDDTGEAVAPDVGSPSGEDSAVDPEPDLFQEEADAPPDDSLPTQDDPAVRAAQSMWTTWHRLVTDAQGVSVRNLTFVEPVESRKVHHVLPSLARIYARLRMLGLPLYRVHCDRARELIADPVKRWLLDRGVVQTLTSGSTYKENGRAEHSVGELKRAMRVVIAAGDCQLEWWPLLARHLGERRLRRELISLGWPAKPLLRFGAKVWALAKSWQDRYDDWRQAREEVVLLGPDMGSSLTNTCYFVQSVRTGRRFFTADVVVASSLPDDAPVEPSHQVCVQERGDQPLPTNWGSVPPPRRLRGKTTVSMLSVDTIEGEMALSSFCSHVVEAGHGWGPTSDAASWTLATPSSNMSRSPEKLKWPPEPGLNPASPDGQRSDGQVASLDGGQAKHRNVLEEDGVCGGDVEEAPNSRAGGSYSAASHSLADVQARLHHFIQDELELLDATTEEQGWCLQVVKEQVESKLRIEEALLKQMRAEDQAREQAVETEFLVTKTVSNREVWADIDAWRESIVKEYEQLTKNKQAVRQVPRSELHRLAQERGLPIELLPSKTVHTRKAGSGLYKTRAVVCGNFSTTTEADTGNNYAGGCDGVAIRTVIRAAAYRGWCLCVTDVRTAFLNAPKRDGTRITAMEVPSVMKHIGLAEPEDIWIIDKALYGLNSSPKDWGVYRDNELPGAEWFRCCDSSGTSWKGNFTKAGDENLWHLVEEETTTGERVVRGLMSVYVDDLMLTGEEPAVVAAAEALANKWSISPLDWATADEPARYCGFEVYADAGGDGYHINQQKYELELLSRWGVTQECAFPAFKIGEDDFAAVDVITPEQIRQSQAMAGALLWLATRTRPDLAYGVTTMCKLSTKNPVKSLEVGNSLLRYIKGCPGGLHYPKGVLDGTWGERDHLKVARTEATAEVFSDISYATGSQHRSVQGIVIFLGGAPVAWQSSQQPFCCHSTAEAELVSLCEALLVGKATVSLVQCVMQVGDDLRLKKLLYGDNMASISLGNGTSTSWRTRHLRIRSSVLKEATDEDLPEHERWELLHLRGTDLVSDGLTKPLQGQAFQRFREDLGLRGRRGEERSGTLLPSSTSGNQPQIASLLAVMVGCAMVEVAEAQPEEERFLVMMKGPEWIKCALLGLGAVYAAVLVWNGCLWLCAQMRRLKNDEDEEDHVIVVSESEDDAASGSATRLSMTSPSGEAMSSATRLSMTSPSGEAMSSATRLSMTSPSGEAMSSATRLSMTSPSGEAMSSATRLSMTSPSGEANGSATRLRVTPKSGGVNGSATCSTMTAQSGDAAGVTTTLSMTSQSGDQASMPSVEMNAPMNDLPRADCGSATSSDVRSTLGVDASNTSRRRSQNQWNRFQQAHKGLGLNSTQLSKMYRGITKP